MYTVRSFAANPDSMPRLEGLVPQSYNESMVLASHSVFLESQANIGFFQIDDLLLVASPGVYHPGPGSSTLFMLKNLPSCENCSLLDMGTGSGALGIHYARQGNSVTMTDVDSEAIRCATFNSLINRVATDVIKSDIFEGIPKSQRFDVVLFNLPFFEKEISHPYEHIGCDPDGIIVSRFLSELYLHLNGGGVCYVTYSNLANVSRLKHLCEIHRLDGLIEAIEYDEVNQVERYLLALRPRVAL